MTTRRGVLQLAAGLGVAGALLPVAADAATVDVELHVLDAEFVPVSGDGAGREVSAITLQITNQEAEAIEPVVFVWGQYNRLMQAWTREDGPAVVPPGTTAELQLAAPGPRTRVYPDQTAQVSVINKGTEARAQKRFVPSEVADGGH